MSSADCYGIQVTARYPARVQFAPGGARMRRRRRDIARDNNDDLYPGIGATRVSPGGARPKSFSANCDRSHSRANFGPR